LQQALVRVESQNWQRSEEEWHPDPGSERVKPPPTFCAWVLQLTLSICNQQKTAPLLKQPADFVSLRIRLIQMPLRFSNKLILFLAALPVS
jgi:hypothetical protein